MKLLLLFSFDELGDVRLSLRNTFSKSFSGRALIFRSYICSLFSSLLSPNNFSDDFVWLEYSLWTIFSTSCSIEFLVYDYE